MGAKPGVSKNNPNARDNSRLIIYCSLCGKEVKLMKVVDTNGNGVMWYRCSNEKDNCEFTHPVYKQSYKDLKYEWVGKK
jgi:hypothetical protein